MLLLLGFKNGTNNYGCNRYHSSFSEIFAVMIICSMGENQGYVTLTERQRNFLKYKIFNKLKSKRF